MSAILEEVKTNNLCHSEENQGSREGEYMPDADSTNKLDQRRFIRTYKTSEGILEYE